MAEIKIPIKIDGFKCVEDMAQAVLNYTYKGKTLKEWADSISKPKTNADRIRAKSVEEMAEFMSQTGTEYSCPPPHYFAEKGFCRNELVDMSCKACWLDWLKQEAENGQTP